LGDDVTGKGRFILRPPKRLENNAEIAVDERSKTTTYEEGKTMKGGERHWKRELGTSNTKVSSYIWEAHREECLGEPITVSKRKTVFGHKKSYEKGRLKKKIKTAKLSK